MKSCFNTDCLKSMDDFQTKCPYCREPQPLHTGVYSFMGAFELGFRRAFNFRGRASRSEILRWNLVSFLGFFAVGIALATLGFTQDQIDGLGALLSLVVLVPNLSLMARRLHDVERSGWLQMLPVGPALLALVFMGPGSGEFIGAILGLAILGAFIWLFWLTWLKLGTDGPNQYGPPRFAGAASQVASGFGSTPSPSPTTHRSTSTSPVQPIQPAQVTVSPSREVDSSCPSCGEETGLLDRLCNSCGAVLVPEGW